MHRREVRRVGGRPFLAASLIVLLVALSAAAIIWNQRVYQAAPDVFWGALETSLTTRGMTCDVDDVSLTSTSQQTVWLDLASGTDLRLLTTLAQNGTLVTTENIITKNNEYIRYTEFESSQKGADGKVLNFEKILNIWGKKAAETVDTKKLYDKTVFGGCIVPLASLDQAKTSKYMAELRKGKVFEVNFSASKQQGGLFKPKRTYEVTIKPTPYLTFMKKLAAEMGSKVHDDINVADYAGRGPEKLTFVIHANSRKLDTITNKNTKRVISFGNYNALPDTVEPTGTISVDELQRRIQAIK